MATKPVSLLPNPIQIPAPSNLLKWDLDFLQNDENIIYNLQIPISTKLDKHFRKLLFSQIYNNNSLNHSLRF